MYKLLKIFILIFILFLGIIIGSINTVGQREYFNISKNNFEINLEKDDYNNLPLIVEQDTSTKIAQTLDNKIYTTLNRIIQKVLGD